MTALDRAILLTIAVGAAAMILAVPRAGRGAEYEIRAERASGALLRHDEPNSHRIRDPDEEPFVSVEDCRQAIKGVRVDKHLRYQAGWKLVCRPVDVPLPRVVVAQ